MKKIFLLCLMLIPAPVYSMDLKLKPRETDALIKKPKKTYCPSIATQALALFCLITATGLALDITTRVEADALNNLVGPITAYPYIPGKGYPFLNGNEPAQKPNCTYTAYDDRLWKPRGLPSIKGDCDCMRRGIGGGSCQCTIEKCPPGEAYETGFNNQLGYNISSIFTRLFALLSISGWIATHWNS